MVQLRLPEYEGPLDLLLELIESRKLDISELSLAQVADQYLAQVASMSPPEGAISQERGRRSSRLHQHWRTPGAAQGAPTASLAGDSSSRRGSRK